MANATVDDLSPAEVVLLVPIVVEVKEDDGEIEHIHTRHDKLEFQRLCAYGKDDAKLTLSTAKLNRTRIIVQKQQ